jgi:hypothetical protein
VAVAERSQLAFEDNTVLMLDRSIFQLAISIQVACAVRNDLEIAAISSQMWYFSRAERLGSANEVL